MGGLSATREATRGAADEEAEEASEEEEDEDSEGEYDDDYREEGQSLATSGLFWGSIAVGAVVVSAAALVALGRRR